MITKSLGASGAAILCTLVLAGCATSRSEIQLASPVAAPAVAATGKTAVIRSVKDERVFEQAPKSPHIPSLGLEGTAAATAETKARAIGRKRNTYGQALGDVLLQPGQTVEGVVRENLTAALAQAGIAVQSAGAATGTPMMIDVRIKQFWSWIQPGFWAITLQTAIDTDLAISGADPVSVQVNNAEGLQIVTDGAWMEAIGKALATYRTEAAQKLGAAARR